MSTATDQELIAAIDARRESALGTLYDRYAGKALAVALQVLKDRDTAEDVIQEVFVGVWESPRYDASRATVAGWLMWQVRNRAIDRLRRRAARGRATERASDRRPTEYHPPERRDSGIALAIGSLPPDQATIIELAFFGGLSQSEIAERLSIPLGTVKSRMRLGMKRLRRVLSDAEHN